MLTKCIIDKKGQSTTKKPGTQGRFLKRIAGLTWRTDGMRELNFDTISTTTVKFWTKWQCSNILLHKICQSASQPYSLAKWFISEPTNLHYLFILGHPLTIRSYKSRPTRRWMKLCICSVPFIFGYDITHNTSLFHLFNLFSRENVKLSWN